MSNRARARIKRTENAETLPGDEPRLVEADEALEVPDALPLPQGNWRIFSPTLDDSGAAYAKLSEAVRLKSTACRTALREIADKASADNESLEALRLRAAALVLHDLIAMGWHLRVAGHFIEVRAPDGDDAAAKTAIRRQLEFGRDDQLREPATRRFIMGLERPSRLATYRPVTDLIADGRRLAKLLEPVARLPRESRAEALQSICQPYLQLVDAETVDTHTGIRLMDIWRYFRHSWATRYRSSPGRNIFYLIRDAAQPNHPVMGITALGNAVMQLGMRDKMLGWTTEGLQALISDGQVTDTEVIEAFRKRLKEDYEQIYVEDLPVAKTLARKTTADVLDRLRIIEEQSVDTRTKRLREGDPEDAIPQRVERPEAADLEALARTPLFRAKRARAVRDILKAFDILRTAKSVATLLGSEDGTWAVNLVIRQLKKQYSATAMMEITVCGGVPPYSDLLGGKLACLMMLSPRVIRDYNSRYDAEASIIASQMAGRPIIKAPNLVFLGTSSLYTQRSSQYNRVKLPATAFAGQRGELAYLELGVSQGYGSPNLSAETEAVLEHLSVRTREYRNVNFVFGEGQSPKMRKLRESFDALGLRRANILHHAASRIIYGVPLATNCARFLLGVDDRPQYILPDDGADEAQVAAFWRSRWLASRLDHAPALEAVAQSSPISMRVSRLVPPTAHGQQTDLFDAPISLKERRMPELAKDDEKIAFLRNLYGQESAYSDEVGISRLRELNVKTPLDDVIRKIVRAGGSVVITGNAGDGKTHTIRLLQSSLKEANAHVIADASEFSTDEILEQWVQTRADGRPFCIAINEGPLIELIRAHKDAHPWLDEIKTDLMNLVRYEPVEAKVEENFKPEPAKTVIIDLSLRRTLSPDLVRRIIAKLTEDTWYAGCQMCPSGGNCPVSYNRKMLRERQVQDRMVELLERVAQRGVRATFRQVLAFISFLIFSGKTCRELLEDANSERTRYYWNAFEGQGMLFETLERGLDPLRQTAPKVDDALWNGKVEPSAFLGHAMFPVVPRNFDAMEEAEAAQAAASFAAIKRRWYFEHAEGKLGARTAAETIFLKLQDAELTPQLRSGDLVALINGWWNAKDRNESDVLRLWTRLAFSPRAQGKAMVSGRSVSSLKLTLFRPVLAPALQSAFGELVIDHLLFGPPGNLRYASLMVDARLIEVLLTHGLSDQNRAIERQLMQFNDSLAQYAEAGSHVRNIELHDPASDLEIKVRVDLSQRRYDSAQ